MDWTRRLPFRFVGNRRRPTLAKIWIGLAVALRTIPAPADGIAPSSSWSPAACKVQCTTTTTTTMQCNANPTTPSGIISSYCHGHGD